MSASETSYINSPCEIKSDENELLATGILAGYYNNELVIRDPRGALALAHYNRPVKIYLHSSELGGREMMGKVYISTNAFMRVKDIRLLASRERRDSFRLAVDLPGIAFRANDISRAQSINRLRQLDYATRVQTEQQIAAVTGEELTEEGLDQRVPKPEIAKPIAHSIQIVDLSAGGLRFKCAEVFRLHERLILNFKLLNKPAELTCLSVRTSGNCEDTHQKTTGCKFLEVSSAQNDLLCAFLLQEQGKQIKKSKRI